ncbi:MAG TPA: helix-turn-helix domain-containing protein [Nitrososphaerales archaeon]|nr:helix-turn-helix domain-containing protein [Nitrososphaerales archaeon]
MGDEEFDANRAIKVLGHPLRIRIIELLATKGPISWKELSKELGTSTGALYHHIDMLERLVDQDSSKKYVLTKFGFNVHAYLKSHSASRDAAGLSQLIKRRSAASVIQSLLIPRSIVYFLTSSKPRSAAILTGASIIDFLLVGFSRSQVMLLSFSPSQSLLLSFESLGGSLLSLTAISYIGVRLIRVKASVLVLLSSASLALLPLAAFSLFLRVLVSSGSLGPFADRNVLTLVFALLQGWSACIAGAGISVASGLRVEKALLVSLALLYVTVLIMFVLGLRFI